MPIKEGVQTSEFWTTILPTLISALLAVLWLVIPGASEKIELAALIAIVLSISVGGGIAAGKYSESRGNVKSNAMLLEVKKSIMSNESPIDAERQAKIEILKSEIRQKIIELENNGGDASELLKVE